MHHGKIVAGLATLSLVGGGTGVALAARGSAPKRANIAAVQTLKVKINRYIQDGLRWDKDVYTVTSGGTLHVVNNDGGRGSAHVHGRSRRRTCPKTARTILNCKICNKLGEAHGADPNSEAPPKFHVPRERRRAGRRAPNVDRPGDSGVTGRARRASRSTSR